MTVVDSRPAVGVPPEAAEPRRHPQLGLDLLLAAAFALCLLGHDTTPSAMWAAVVYALVAPGDLLRRACGIAVSTLGERLVHAVAGSIAVLLGICVVVEGICLLIGIGQPFDRGPLLVGTGIAVGVLLMAAHREGGAEPGPLRVDVSVPTLLLAPLPPLMALGGSAYLDSGHGPGLTVAAFAVATVGLVLGCAVSSMRRRGDLALLVFSLSLAVLWSFTTRSRLLYGFDIHQEYAALTSTLDAALWRPEARNAYNSTLSLTSLPALLHSLTGLPGMDVLRLVYPALMAVFPTSVFVLLRRYAGALPSLAVTLALTGNPAGLWQLSGVARQEVALVLFGSMVLVLVLGRGTQSARTGFSIVLGVACVLAHYSTAYVAIAVFGLAALAGWIPLRRSRATRPHRRVPAALPLVMIVAAVGWNIGINDSANNVVEARAAYVASGPGLEDRGNFVSTWLSGQASEIVPPRELFDATRAAVPQRPWLQPYSAAVQQQFPAVTKTPAVPPALAPALQEPATVGYTIFRQLLNLAVVAGVLLLLWRVRRPGRIRSSGLITVAALAGSTLAVTAAVRVSSALSQSYNPERLAIQVSPVFGLAIVMGISYLQARRRRRGLVALLAPLVLAVALLDATGVRALLVGGTAGNLQTTGEHVNRYYETDQDAAAATWLEERFSANNMVFADRYGALFLRDHPKFTEGGLLDTLTPPLLDQRAFVYGTSENIEGGRARAYYQGRFSTYAFPTRFLDRLKNVVYSNGSSRVWD